MESFLLSSFILFVQHAVAAILWNKALPIQLRVGQYQKFLVTMSENVMTSTEM